jgi:peptidyl-tRNA hydrolase, PTH1 family
MCQNKILGGELMASINNRDIKAIIGLGNPGQGYYYHRHSIGFRVLDDLAARYGVKWLDKDIMKITQIIINDHKVMLIKPMTYMNSSGAAMTYLIKQGIRPQNVLVVHDELEKPFGTLAFKIGGSHRGHNGLRSIIGACCDDFARLRFGVGRPANKDEVPDYVLSNFDESDSAVQEQIDKAVAMIENLY